MDDTDKVIAQIAARLGQPIARARKAYDLDPFTYNVSLGLSAPSLTTVPSRVRYHAGTLTLFAPSNDTLVATMEAVATVCKDDPAIAFYCSNHGMNASLEDAVPLQL